MATIVERLEQIEAALDAEGGGQVIVIMLMATQADVREMPRNPQDWLTYGPVLAKTEVPPYGPRTICLSATDERKARAAAAIRN